MDKALKNLLVLLPEHAEVHNKCLNIFKKEVKNVTANIVFDMINSTDANERKAGIFLMICFLPDLNFDEGTSGVTHFARNLLNILKTIGVIFMKTSKSHAVELVELAFNHCFEWLEEEQGSDQQRRLASVVLAKDLALFTPSHFFQRATAFFNNIFKVLRDPRLNVRLAAAEAFQAALAVTSQRETKHKKEWYKRSFHEACRTDFVSFGLPTDDCLHSSLLIFNELLRIADYEYEQIRIQHSPDGPIVQLGSRAGSVIGQNPIGWLIEKIHPPTVESSTSRTLITDCFFAEVVKRCMDAMPSKSVHCQIILLEILPRLANFVDSSHGHQFQNVQESADHLIAINVKFPQALLTLGLLSLNRPIEMRNRVQRIFQILVQHMQTAVNKKKQVSMLDFQCLSLLIQSQKSHLCERVRESLSLMFSTGISEGLIHALHVTIEHIPELKADVFDGLMDHLYQLLMDRPRPSKLAPPMPPPIPSGPIQPKNIPQTQLALKALGEFNFSRHSLQMFLRYVALGYLTSDPMKIRLTSVYSCSEMLKPFVDIYEHVQNEQKAELYSLIRNVLECLVKTAIVDPEPDVRMFVLKSFCGMNRDFLFHLAQQEILETLFLTMQDENHQVQEQATELLGMLSELNPAFVFLRFRRVVLESVSQLVNSHRSSVEEHSARMIARLAKQSPKFMAPYMNSTLLALISHLKTDRSNVEVTVDVLNALSELSLIGGQEIDTTSLNRREAALRAMAGVCQSAGYVVEPYKDYPELLDALLKLLKTELSSSMRRLTMKVLGVIGAFDPYTHKVYLGKVHSHSKSRSLALTLPNSGESAEHYGTDIIQWINYERCTLAEYYPALAISNLTQMMREPQLTSLHKEIVNALLQIFSNLGPKTVQYVHQLLPTLIGTMENCRPELRGFFLRQFSKFVSIARLQLQPYMKQIFGLIAKAWKWSDDSNLRGSVITIIEEFGNAFGDKFSPYITDLCPYLINVVQNDTKERKLTAQALSCTRTISACLGSHLHLILPPILSVLDDRKTDEKTRTSALDTVLELARRHPIEDYAPPIMQTWLRCIGVKAQQPRLVELLCIIVRKWKQFSVYKENVNAALEQLTLLQTPSYSRQQQNVTGGVVQHQPAVSSSSPLFARQVSFLPPPPPTQQNGETHIALLPDAYNNIGIGLPGPGSSTDMSRAHRMSSGRDLSRLAINLDQLRRFWTVQPLLSREDWLQWLGTLRNQFVRQSPSPALRACALLAEVCEPLSKELFNAAFMSVWTELPEREQNELTSQLIDVLQHCPHSEPAQAILNLAEFMDHSEKGPLPIKYRMLSESAEKTRAYAKALRYKEMEILSVRGNGEPNADDCQTMIMLFNKLNLEEGAAGIVQYAKRHNMEISGRWYEKLGEWEKALEMYRQEILALPDEQFSWKSFSSLSEPQLVPGNRGGMDQSRQSSAGQLVDEVIPASASANRIATHQPNGAHSSRSDLLLHQIRCLEALGQWSQLDRVCETALIEEENTIHHQQHNNNSNNSEKQKQLQQQSSRSGARLPQLQHHRQQQQQLLTDTTAEYLLATLSEVAKRQKVATMGARGCWAVGNFKKMEEYVEKINENNQEGAFLRAVLAVHNNDFEKAYSCINKVRDMFDSELTAMAAESYERAYGAMVLLQELTELEEAIEYKMIPEREMRIALLWSRRLQGCRRNIEHWRRILMVRSIVFSQTELRPLWIKFAALCRHEGNQVTVARNVVRSLLEVPSDVPLEKLWSDGHRRTAFTQLEQLTQNMRRCIECSRTLTRDQLEPHLRLTAKCYLKLGEWHDSITSVQTPLVPTATPPLTGRHGSVSFHSGASTAALSAGIIEHKQPFTWATTAHQQTQQPMALMPSPTGTYFAGMDQSCAKKSILQYYINATNYDPNWYKAWHRLATTYYNMVMADRQQRSATISPTTVLTAMPAQQTTNAELFTSTAVPYPPQGIPPATLPPQQISPVQSPLKNHQLITIYALNAVRCFFKTIQLAEGSRLDDTLRLLMLWFDYGDRPEVFEQLRDSVKLIPREVWLEVVPQLIGRLDSQQNIGLLVKQLVIDVAKEYPQAWVCALTAATKSRNSQRSQVAKEVLDIVAESRPVLVEQAMLVNDELIRCAILWHELWHESLENASRFYFEDKNVEEMMNVLRPLHQKIEQGHTTLKEQSFNQAYYKDLKDALEHCEAFRRTRNLKEMTIAWELYYNVFKRIISQLRQMSTLDLNYIAPRLCTVKNLELSVPGTYDPATPLVTIAAFHPHLQVIMSKQRPRKIYIRGNDGKEYAFLLKGHEDPRQDERVMQLFGLVNSLILREAETSRRNLTIQRYSITTLSQSSGLIGWVPNCDTLHALIRDYREKRKIPISEEHNKMQKLCVDIEKCTLLQKVEAFEEALRTTSGDDLRRTLWMKSPNSEIWFDRRTNYTRSMACMSMVGYILGLGDRHPSNLMLDRLSGKIVHIDFGDCFEVAMKREKYPEKIPFRLTRMLVQAMEVTGIDGNYRVTCERVLRLLRNHNDSVLAVLEAFVYDPVLNWRLTQEGGAARRAAGGAHHMPPGTIGPHTTAPVEESSDTAQLHQHDRHPFQPPPRGLGTSRGDSEAISRVRAKLCGRDFNPCVEISVQEQTDRLIEQATLNDNLCQCYVGWCPFW
uniref:Serine/threonine-protein kinase TOR n=1 Tax=Globodera rostochiensis TaxID=31243 RepID=A0A914I1V5_GLORO